jgi:hypothetical protein
VRRAMPDWLKALMSKTSFAASKDDDPYLNLFFKIGAL